MEKGKDKLIYVHVASLEEDSERSRSKEIWYLIKQRSDGDDVDGVELRRVSEDIKPLNYPYSALLDPNCEVVGSCIYVIGGHSRGGGSAVVDDRWLYIFGIDRYYDPRGWESYSNACPFYHGDKHGCLGPWGYAVDCSKPEDEERRRRRGGRIIARPGDSAGYHPAFSTCLSPGKIVVCMGEENTNTLYELDCKNSTWRVYQKDLPYSPEKLRCETVVDDGILYIYDNCGMQLTCYDIRNKKELYVVDLPRSFWFGHKACDVVKLIVLSKNRFCIINNIMRFSNGSELYIYYMRFSVSCYDHQPEHTVVVEEKKSFSVAGHGYWFLNVVAVDPCSAVSNSTSSNSDAVMLSMSKWRDSEETLENYMNNIMFVKKQRIMKFENRLRWSKRVQRRRLEASMRKIDHIVRSPLKKGIRLKRVLHEVIKQDIFY
ncbi:hypothetical protein K1719_003183 [Acacia pycnantha]|nr:hypothetical protein K1719_003183 [Acacia pycnantha]